jgi:hypothetical protein
MKNKRKKWILFCANMVESSLATMSNGFGNCNTRGYSRKRFFIKGKKSKFKKYVKKHNKINTMKVVWRISMY